jgi:adenosylcobinamide-GDP ribazoletransferase
VPGADGLRLALTTLTVLPVRGVVPVDRRTAGTAMALAPGVGLLVGVLAASVGKVLHTAGADLLAAVLAVAALALLTRGLHLDGLVDTVDGLASYRPREQALQVMRSPEAGPVGVAALVLVLLTQVAALQACEHAGRGSVAIVLAAMTGRAAVTLSCTRGTPAASSTGLGATVAGTVPRPVAALVAAAVLTAGAGAAALDDDMAAWTGGLAVVVALLLAAGLRRHAVKRLGGITGDVLGALVELTTAAVLVTLAVA